MESFKRDLTSLQPVLYFLSPVFFVALSALLASTTQTTLLATLSLGIYLLLAFHFWKQQKFYFLAVFPFFFGYLGATVSNVYLEKGVYISEQYGYSSATGATFRLVFYSLIFLIGCGAFLRFIIPLRKIKILAHKNIEKRHTMLQLTTGFLIACLVVLWIANLIFGIPIAQGLTRFDYWKDHPLPQLRTFLVQLSQLAFVLGWLHGSTESHKQRRMLLKLLAFIFVTNISYGDKFSSNFLSLMNFATSSIAARLILFPSYKINPRRVATIGLIVIGAFYLLISWFYSNINKIDADQVNEYILDRILALQGHTWWGVDYLVKNEFPTGNIFDLFHRHTDTEPGGLYMLMYAISPTQAVNSYLENGITYTMGGSAMAIYTLGYWWACIYMLVAGLVVSLSLMYLWKKAAQFQLFRTLIALKIVWLEILAFNMGNFYLLFGSSTLIYLFMVLFDLTVIREKPISLAIFRPKT